MKKKYITLLIASLLMSLGGVFFLILSFGSDGNSTVFLMYALLLVAFANFTNLYNSKKVRPYITENYCGVDCEHCPFKEKCGGCKKTNGAPLGVQCNIAKCALSKKKECSDCKKCDIRSILVSEINALGIESLPEVTFLFPLVGEYVNLEYDIDGEKKKLLDDRKIYFGCQLDGNDGRCFGVVADESMILVCSYGENGTEPRLIYHKAR